MPLLGSAAMLLQFDVAPEAIDEHDRWHTHEHLPERLSIPGFLRGTRWTATGGVPRYMVLYEVRDLQTLTSEAYLARLDDPTPWTRRIMPSYRGMRRGLCSVIGSVGHGQGGASALIRFSGADGRASALHRWLLESALPQVPSLPGLGSAHLLQGSQAAAMTNEQRLRGADQGVASAIVITGYEDGLVTEFAARLGAPDGLPRHGAQDVTLASYRASYTLDRHELGA